MRRLVTVTALCVLVLSGCRRFGSLPSAEVLQRATAASAQLESAQYEARVEITSGKAPVAFDARAELHGILGHGGQETAFSAAVNGSFSRAGLPQTAFTVQADVVSEPTDAYVLFHTLSFNPALSGLTGSQGLLGSWLRLPRDTDAPPALSLTPDPLFLRAQASVVNVVEDKGLERMNDKDAYHYIVSINPERLLALMQSTAESNGRAFDLALARDDLAKYDATGELWIDAGTFLVRRLVWNVTSKQAAADTTPFRVMFSADLAMHNTAPSITIPSDARLVPPTLLRSLLPSP
ncbi:hypothetical protein EXS70_01950 [Candidatus Peribacteria bacterium]|nr:hypothetical protein [Candidatus Peribacteria bacterium]